MQAAAPAAPSTTIPCPAGTVVTRTGIAQALAALQALPGVGLADISQQLAPSTSTGAALPSPGLSAWSCAPHLLHGGPASMAAPCYAFRLPARAPAATLRRHTLWVPGRRYAGGCEQRGPVWAGAPGPVAGHHLRRLAARRRRRHHRHGGAGRQRAVRSPWCWLPQPRGPISWRAVALMGEEGG